MKVSMPLMSKLVKTLSVLGIALAVAGGLRCVPAGASRAPSGSALALVSSPEGKRVALVVGNASYQFHSRLKNPQNDADGIAQALTDLGFQVMSKPNLKRDEIKQSIQDFAVRINGGEVGLFYYAGHGVQVNGNNYLIPVDARITNLEEVEREAVNVDILFEAMREARTGLNIIILDACRDNPFRGLANAPAALRELSSGLAPPKNAPAGTLIAYATDPGRVASDGSGRHSPYTRALLKFIRHPGQRLEDFFKLVREHVRENTDGEQTPWENTSLEGDFFFRPPVFLECIIEAADDEAYLYINNSPFIVSGGGGGWKKTQLNAGSNSMEIKVYNQKTRRGIIGPREGWRYSVKCRASGQEKVYAESEDNPPDERWGKTFTRITTTIDVDESTGLATIR